MMNMRVLDAVGCGASQGATGQSRHASSITERVEATGGRARKREMVSQPWRTSRSHRRHQRKISACASRWIVLG